MALSELSTFMAAMRRMQSGSFAGMYYRASGAYGISTANWESWSKQAGLSGADRSSKSAQDAVARYKMTQLYNRYADWRLVGIAWLDGTGAADQARKEGLSRWQTDVSKITSYMHGAADAGYGAAPKPPPDIVSQLDSQARDAIERGTLSVDAEFQPEEVPDTPGYVPRGNYYYPPSQPAPTILVERQQATAPQAQQLTPFGKSRVAKSDMHRNMAAILQGLSNAVRKGVQGLPEAEQVTTEEQQEGLE